MKKIDIHNLTIEKAHDDLLRGEYSARDLAGECLRLIEGSNPQIFAFLEVYDDILKQATSADEKIKYGKAGLLTGIPAAVKDNILVGGRVASAASKILENYKAVYDSSVTKKLKEEGVVFVGRTNMDEFAMGGSTENSAFGVTKNPHDLERVAGGSSGGSAVAVATGMALFSLGSDTGGSIRQPASFCGVVGFKPTYGAVSRYGLIAMGSSLDQIGPFTKTVRDAEIVFNSISFHDELDSTSVAESARGKDSQKVSKVGVPYDFVERDGIDAEVLANFKEVLEGLRVDGYEIVPISLKNLAYSLSVYYVLMPAEVSSNLARFDGVRYGLSVEGGGHIESFSKTRAEGFGNEARRRIIMGTYVLSHGYYDAYYNKANAVRGKIRDEFREAFKEVDVIAMPTSPTPAFRIGEKTKDPLAMYLADIFTVPANITGVPAISVPSGKTKSNLPLGVQFMAPHFCERRLFEVGEGLEKVRN